MRLHVLSSGSEGNSAVVRAGELAILVDAGLPRPEMEKRLELARLGPGALEHVLVTHGHLDHARSSGALARRERATLHAPESMLSHPWARRARRLAAVAIDRRFELASHRGAERIEILGVPLPHDCDPTLAYRIEHEGRSVVILTDMGRPDDDVARRLCGAHVLVLEFNWDPSLMSAGPYSAMLQRRITGDRGHLSNAQAAAMLERLASENLHTLVLAHLSQKTNRPEIALEAARAVLERLGLAERVRVIVARQDEALDPIDV